ncbi:hypothetical protein UQW22_08685 [Isoptericola halotolerans]|uniref:hypothetical protein n=1 Tax=Isoptericola halotolerans TaxID=300560 RepID=UPI00388FF108
MTLAVFVLAGCSASEEIAGDAPELWRVQIDQVLASESEHVTEAHRQILADYTISEAEYGELRQQLSDCLSGHGIEHDMDPDQGGSLETADIAGDDDGSRTLDLTTGCLDSTTGPVEAIYLGMRENPEGLGPGEAMRRCLDEAGATELAGVPGAELDRQIKAAEMRPTTPEAMVCLHDPFGTNGLTPDAARELLAGSQMEAGGE